MTDTTQPVPASVSAPLPDQQPPADTATPPDAQPEPQDDGKNGEAAKYRRQLREAEAERDQLRANVETLRRRDAEGMVAETLASPKLLWALGATPADLIGDDGTVDAGKVRAVADAVLAEYGEGVRWRRDWRGGRSPLEGRAPRNSNGPRTTADGFAAAFNDPDDA